MNNKPLLLSLCFGLGLCFHAAVLLGIHNLPIKKHTRSLNYTHSNTQNVFDQQNRAELIAEVFNHIQKSKPEVKHQFHDLHPEYAPSIEIGLNPNSARNLELDPFAFEPDLSPLPDDREHPLGNLISNAPVATSIDMPTFSLEEDSLSNHFDIEVEYAPKRNRPGYVFKATFHPHSDVAFESIQQNVFFVIDRSNSIPRARYTLNKKAVADALTHLEGVDTFNILIFDDHVVQLAPHPLSFSEENIDKARVFLEKQGHRGHFAATELYASLGKIIPHDVNNHEVNTAILLTDGDSYLSREKQRQLIADWTARNKGKVSLYTIASGAGNNLPLLDLVSAFNQGRLIYSQDHNELNAMIRNLLATAHSPIGKEMVATPITADKQTAVLLQPKAIPLPDLYKDRPFVVYGSINYLSDIVLFLQGKHYDKRFDIKKTISFEHAKIGSFSLERKWTQLLAQEHYANYLGDGNKEHLESVKRLLRPMNIPTPWID